MNLTEISGLTYFEALFISFFLCSCFSLCCRDVQIVNFERIKKFQTPNCGWPNLSTNNFMSRLIFREIAKVSLFFGGGGVEGVIRITLFIFHFLLPWFLTNFVLCFVAHFQRRIYESHEQGLAQRSLFLLAMRRSPHGSAIRSQRRPSLLHQMLRKRFRERLRRVQ